ncbi:MAG: glycosyltransferase family 4 protein [Acidobacteriota bacterium]|jgi:glycosyltransferase involved in cell wall biosynthesis
MARTKVLSITPFFLFEDYKHLWNPRFDPLGGMQLLTHGIITRLAERGVEQEVLTMGIPGVPKDVELGDRVVVRSRRLPVLPIKSKLEGYFGLVLAWGIGGLLWVLRNRKRLKREIGVVHVHMDGSGSAPALGYLAARLLDAPLVAQVYSCRNLTQEPTTLFERIFDPVSKWSERRTLAGAEHVLTLTDKVKNRLADLLPDARGTFERLAFLTTTDFRERDTPERRRELIERFDLPRDRPIVMYLGRIAAEKGVEYLVDAVKILSERQDYHYLIAGDGPEREEIDEQIDRLGLRDVCTVTGFLEPELVPSAVALSTIGVVPSKYEELGLIILEFMLMDKPVIAHDVGGVSELIQDRETGLLVRPYDPPALAAAIEELVGDAELRERLAAAAAPIPDRYSLDAAVVRLAEVYGELGRAE